MAKFSSSRFSWRRGTDLLGEWSMSQIESRQAPSESILNPFGENCERSRPEQIASVRGVDYR